MQDRSEAPGTARAEIVNMLMRHFDTDTLLCWAPTGMAYGPQAAMLEGETTTTVGKPRAPTLRELQISTARPIVSFLTERVWPGVEIGPVLEDGSIVARAQAEGTREVVRGWIGGLGAWELAGLERAVLAGKSLCVGARLVCEWAKGLVVEEAVGGVRETQGEKKGERRFGVEEAAAACSLEVAWQTGMWGEVEDSHDVQKEDLKRQLGSVVLIVSQSEDEGGRDGVEVE